MSRVWCRKTECDTGEFNGWQMNSRARYSWLKTVKLCSCWRLLERNWIFRYLISTTITTLLKVSLLEIKYETRSKLKISPTRESYNWTNSIQTKINFTSFGYYWIIFFPNLKIPINIEFIQLNREFQILYPSWSLLYHIFYFFWNPNKIKISDEHGNNTT